MASSHIHVVDCCVQKHTILFGDLQALIRVSVSEDNFAQRNSLSRMDVIMIMTAQEVYRLAGNYPDAQRPCELRALHVRNYLLSKFFTNYR